MGIEFINISKSFNGKDILTNLSFSIPSTGVFGIFGPSGSGKTTLLRILCGLEVPDSGKLTGTDGLSFSVVFQEDRLLKSNTVLENVAIVSDKETAADILRKVGLGDYLSSYPNELSGGMRRRVAIARALAYRGDVLILDEPLKGLETDLKDTIASYFMDYSKEKPVILVTHDEIEKQLAGSSITLSALQD